MNLTGNSRIYLENSRIYLGNSRIYFRNSRVYLGNSRFYFRNSRIPAFSDILEHIYY